MLLEQRYSPEDDLAHIRSLLPIFLDPRYIRVGDRPLFLVYREALRAGLKDLFLVRVEGFRDDCGDPRETGFDSGLQFQPQASLVGNLRIYRRKWWHSGVSTNILCLPGLGIVPDEHRALQFL